MTDAVREIVERWRVERPDLDPAPMLVVGRIGRLAQTLDTLLRPPFAAAGLGRGEFDVLAALRRAGEPFARTPSELTASLMVTSGAVTKQVDRLVAKGLVGREVDPRDGRGRRIALTATGRGLVDELVAVHLDNERRVLSHLTPAQLRGLEAGLARLAETLESDEV